MPFSLDKEFYFVRVPKTAGTYLLDILRANVPDLVDAGHTGFPPVKIDGVNHGDHIKLGDIEGGLHEYPDRFARFSLTPEIFRRLKKFAVVRNPYTRTLSLLSFYSRFNRETYTPKTFEQDLEKAMKEDMGYHFDQSSFVCDPQTGALLVDRLFYVEEDFLQSIGEFIGVELGECSERVNVTRTRRIPDSAYFESFRVRQLIQELLRVDFEKLGYPIDSYP